MPITLAISGPDVCRVAGSRLAGSRFGELGARAKRARGPGEAARSADIPRKRKKAAAAGRKPNSVRLRLASRLAATARYGGDDHSSSPVITDGIKQPTRKPRTGRPMTACCQAIAPPYLALLRAGFCLPRLLPDARCALTAPFHPYLFAPAVRPKRPSAVCFLCHFPSSCPDRALPGALPCGVRTFLLGAMTPRRSSGLLRRRRELTLSGS